MLEKITSVVKVSLDVYKTSTYLFACVQPQPLYLYVPGGDWTDTAGPSAPGYSDCPESNTHKQ